MTAEPGSARYRRWFGIYLLAVAAVSTLYGAASAHRAGGWAIGEWLINYSAGFVRRGLPGELILLIGRSTGAQLPWIAFAMQEAVYLLFLWCAFLLTRGVRWTWMMAALLVSPATLTFLVLDPPNGFKKEILLFALLAGLQCLLRFGHPRGWRVAALLSLGCAALVLSHEGLLAYLPYVFAALAVHQGVARALRVAAFPAAACGVAGIAVLKHLGDLAIAETICSSISGHLSRFGAIDDGVCGGAIVWLQENFQQAHHAVVVAARVHHSLRLYAPLAVLALAPAVLALTRFNRNRHARHEVHLVAACSLLAMAASLLLFYSGRDWGRWIHIHAVCLMLLVLMLSHRTQRAAAPPPAGHIGPKRWISACALVLYATCWTLPAVDIYPARAGYFGLYHYLKNYAQR